MFSRLSRLFDLLQNFGGFGSITEFFELIPTLWTALGQLGDAETAEDYHRIAISLLEPLAIRTTNDLDDGVLLAFRALSKDPEWLTWVDDKLGLGTIPPDVPTFQVTPEQLAQTYRAEDTYPQLTAQAIWQGTGPVPATAQAMTFSSLASITKWLPLLLQVLNELSDLKDLFGSSGRERFDFTPDVSSSEAETDDFKLE